MMSPKMPMPEPTWKLYDAWYHRGYLIGETAREQGEELSLTRIVTLARLESVPLCMWTDFKDGCQDGYNGLERARSQINQ
jgi:hypothetical protein